MRMEFAITVKVGIKNVKQFDKRYEKLVQNIE